MTGPHVRGTEWVVEAFGCDAAALADPAAMRALFDAVIAEMALRPVAPPVWHQFPPPGGITGLCPLAESHLACHTFPEHGSLCLNVFCCREHAGWDWHRRLHELVGAADVRVRRIERPYAAMAPAR